MANTQANDNFEGFLDDGIFVSSESMSFKSAMTQNSGIKVTIDKKSINKNTNEVLSSIAPNRNDVSNSDKSIVKDYGERPKVFDELKYTDGDKGPFRVLVERKRTDSSINKISVGRIIKNNNLYENMIDMKRSGRKKVVVYYQTIEAANLLLEKRQVFQENYFVYIPTYFISVKGVVTGIPMDFTIEEMKEEISSEVEVLDVFRMNKRIQGIRTPSDRVCIVFRSTQLPTYVKMCFVRSRVDPFISKVIYCEKCLRFNHSKENCKAKLKCGNCCKSDCESIAAREPCKNAAFCMHCKGKHQPIIGKECNENEKQHKIKMIMAKRAVSYTEAKEQFSYFSENIYESLRVDDEINVFEIFEQNLKKSKADVCNKKHKTTTREKRCQREISVDSNVEKCLDPMKKKTKIRLEEAEDTGVALHNPHRTSNVEKFLSGIEKKEGFHFNEESIRKTSKNGAEIEEFFKVISKNSVNQKPFTIESQK